jgi:hypothetical protein
MSLLFIIPAVWLVIAVVVVVLCRGAQDGDAILDEALEPARRKAQLSGVVILKETSSAQMAEPDAPAIPEPAARDDERVLAAR